MKPQGFGDLASDTIERVKRGHRFLKDHGDLAATNLVELTLGHSDEFLTAIAGRTACTAIGRQQSHQRHRGLAFAGPGFTDDCNSLAGHDIEIDVFDGVNDAVIGVELDIQTANLEDRIVDHVSDPSGRAHRAGHRQGS